LPSQPKIFHGRDSQLDHILQLFRHKAPRVVILGPGGIGKSSLAKAVLHHPTTSSRYGQHRFFVACDATRNKVELAAHIGTHLGLKPGNDLTKPVLRYFARSAACLLVLDNLETVWEPINTRGDIEEFLSLL
ncbi:hypothetical protein C8R43DRAFT_828051, partial [Mycena crocata]